MKRRGLAPRLGGWAAALALGALPGVEAGAQTVQLVSRADPAVASEAAGGGGGTISADGRYVVFVSSHTHVVGQVDTNASADVFLHDRTTGLTRLVSHRAGMPTTAADGGSYSAVISADGSSVAFLSSASDLVPGFSGWGTQLFLYSRADGSVTLVSHRWGSPTAASTGHPIPGSMSSDGSHLVFQSDATDLVAGEDTNDGYDTFLYTRASATVTLLSHARGSATIAANAPSRSPALISADGSSVVFRSTATNLAKGPDEPDTLDAFLVERASGAVTRLGLANEGVATSPDGNDIVMEWFRDPFPVPPAVSGTSIYSRRDGTWTEIDGRNLTFSADGAHVVFLSSSTSLVPGFVDASPGSPDAYLWSRVDGTTTLISGRADAPTPTGVGARSPTISADGSHVVFISSAPDLVPGSDTNGAADVFVYSRSLGTNALVSHAEGSPTTAGSSGSNFQGSRAVSADGGSIVYSTAAGDLTPSLDRNDRADVVVFDRGSGTNTLISRRPPGPPSLSASNPSHVRSWSGASVSADGRFVAFLSTAADLVPGQVDTNGVHDVFLSDQATGEVELVSHAFGLPTTAGNRKSGAEGFYPDIYWGSPVISADGRFVAFVSGATDLLPPESIYNTCCATGHLFLYDRTTKTVELVSRGRGRVLQTGDQGSQRPSISADGSYLVFETWARNLGPESVVEGTHVYLYERATGSLTLVTRSATTPNASGNSSSYMPAISADGNWVTFSSAATDLIAGMTTGASPWSGPHVFLYSRADGSLRLASPAAGQPLTGANHASGHSELRPPAISADGSHVAFASMATDLVPGSDTFGTIDVFLYSRSTGTVELVSHAAGLSTRAGNGHSGLSWRSPYGLTLNPLISADGRYVAFESLATDLVAGVDTNGTSDVFVYDRSTGVVTLASHAFGEPGRAGNAISTSPSISADGGIVVFLSDATDLVAGTDGNGTTDVFVHRRSGGSVSLASRASGDPGRAGNGKSGTDGPSFFDVWPAALSADGRWVAFASLATDLVAGDLNSLADVFLFGPARPGADLAVGLFGPASAVAGTDAVYTVAVVNNGGEAAAAVVVSLATPPGLIFRASDACPGGFPCALGAVPAGAARLISVAFHVPSGYGGAEPITYGVEVATLTPDPDPGNDTASLTTAVVRSADLRLSLTGPATATPPSQLGYTLLVANHGPSDAASVWVTDPDPPGLVFLSNQGDCTGAFPCGLGTVPAGESRTIHTVFGLPAGYGGPDPIVSEAEVTSATPDPDTFSDGDMVFTPLDRPVATYGFFTVEPCRIVDTRRSDGALGGPALAAGSDRAFRLAGACGIPSTANAVVLNVAVTAATAAGHLRLHPAGAPVPPAAAITYGPAQTRSSHVVARLNEFGFVNVRCSQSWGTVHFVLDVTGYFE